MIRPRPAARTAPSASEGRRRFRRIPLAALALALALPAAVSACLGTTPVATPSAPFTTPSPDPAIAATRNQLEGVLRGAGFGLIDYRQPYRPPESAALAPAPRGVFQVVLPDDPGHGEVVVYDLRDAPSATAAGREFAAYLATGPTRVQFPPDTHFVLRQVGSTLVFFTWSQANSPDRTGGRAADAIDTLGTGFGVS